MEFEVIEAPKLAAKPIEIAQPKPQPKIQEEPVRKVFGVSRKALTDSAENSQGPSVKQGNTLATAPDDKKLLPSDADSLPVPTDEYLVTSMPSTASEIRIPYPPEAKQKGIEGPVVMDLLIDDQGHVRSATLISGPGYGLNEAAVGAIKQFLFHPAHIGDKPVAVKIHYTYRFVLEK